MVSLMGFCIVFSIICLVLITVGSFFFIRLAKKILIYEEWVSIFMTKVEDTHTKLNDIDKSGLFENDDDTGFIFKEIKDLIDSLYNFVEGTEDEEDL